MSGRTSYGDVTGGPKVMFVLLAGLYHSLSLEMSIMYRSVGRPRVNNVAYSRSSTVPLVTMFSAFYTFNGSSSTT